MNRLGFRPRLFVILALFAFVPAIVLTLAWGGTVSFLMRRMGGTAAWDSAAATGNRALAVARRADPLSLADRAVLSAHEQELSTSLTNAGKFAFLARKFTPRLLILAVLLLAALGVLASRVAGHLSRQLSRPLQEVVGWTELIRRGEPLPAESVGRGAPEFGLLRDGMRQMAVDLEAGRRAALQAQRLEAFRESARQVAHELKNPLTPIRFAVDRLKRNVGPELSDAVEVLVTESARLESMARSFAQFGKLPEGPTSEVDMGELLREVAHTTVPQHLTFVLDISPDTPLVRGQHDALGRSVSNVLLNAVDACGATGTITASVRPRVSPGGPEIELSIRDSGAGIPADRIDSIWEPYVTGKAGGTGLGLAIVKQTVVAHRGYVEAESGLGTGAVIRLIFPAAMTAGAAG